MAYTSFGEFVRILRVKHHEVMGDMAGVLGASLPFLSAVENGKKNVPADWVAKLTEHYRLSSQEQQELIDAVEESKTQYKIVSYVFKLNYLKIISYVTVFPLLSYTLNT